MLFETALLLTFNIRSFVKESPLVDGVEVILAVRFVTNILADIELLEFDIIDSTAPAVV